MKIAALPCYFAGSKIIFHTGAMMSAILFDLDGVLYVGDRAIEGAADAVDWFVQRNIPHLFLTNTTSKSRAALVEKLAGFGIQSTVDSLLTPPVAARQWLHSRNLVNIALFVAENTAEEFSAFNIVTGSGTPVDAVVIGDLGEHWTFSIMNTVLRILLENPQAILVALGMTRYWRAAAGLQLDVGPMVKAFEYAAGVEAVVTGKPAATYYQSAIDILGPQQTIVMIGDDIRGDIEAAQKAGLKTLLVRTGKFSEADLKLGIIPDGVLESVAQLPPWWQANMQP
jgi:HAD superfamily hydrolase (TIGR01458 family)